MLYHFWAIPVHPPPWHMAVFQWYIVSWSVIVWISPVLCECVDQPSVVRVCGSAQCCMCVCVDQPSVVCVCGSAQCCMSVWISPVVCVCECVWISPVLCVCESAQCCVCVSWSLALHLAGTWYNSLHSRPSLSFNSKDSGVYCSQLFICFIHSFLYASRKCI